ncbi:gluconokinase [Salibacterium sp. K-3]
MKASLGIDLGTTSAKAVLFALDGTVIAEAETFYPVLEPEPGYMEQDPYDIEQAVIRAIRQAVDTSGLPSEDIETGGFSSAMHSLLCVDENMTALTNLLIWSDRRSVPQAGRLSDEKKQELYERTGTPIHPMSPLLKLRWMYENEYPPYHQAVFYVSMKEFILQRWFQEKVVDYATASASGLFNIHKLQWDTEALAYAGISASRLFTPVPPTYTMSGLTKEIAEKTALSIHMLFAAGASDGPLANLGVGAVDSSKTVITVGTSGAVRQLVDKPMLDPEQRVFCYAVSENQWVMGGPTNNGGNVLEWLRQTLKDPGGSAGASVESWMQMADETAPGADGLLFLPFLNGERAPHWDAQLAGSFFGLRQSHTNAHMTRAGLEGVIFELYSIQEAMDTLGSSSDTIYANGGFARSGLWLQILADVFARPVKVPVSHQSSAWGAACTALLAAGKYESYAEGTKETRFHTAVPCDQTNTARYESIYPLYRRLIEQTRQVAHDLQAR